MGDGKCGDENVWKTKEMKEKSPKKYRKSKRKESGENNE